MLPLALRQATTTMLSGRPGPVNVDVPFNVYQEEDDVEVPKPAPPLGAQRSGPSPEEITACVDLILNASQPVIFVGHGVDACRGFQRNSPNSFTACKFR